MQVRRWKYLQENDPSPLESKPEGQERHGAGRGTTNSGHAVQIQFINASHPQDVISHKAKRMIRSHAARDFHASRRRREADNTQLPPENETLIVSGFERESASGDGRHLNPSAADGGIGGKEARKDEILPRVEPVSFLSATSKDPFSSLARPMVDAEHFLIEHCTARHQRYYMIAPRS